MSLHPAAESLQTVGLEALVSMVEAICGPAVDEDEVAALQFVRHHRRISLGADGTVANGSSEVDLGPIFPTALTGEPMESGSHVAHFTLAGDGGFNVGVASAEQDPNASEPAWITPHGWGYGTQSGKVWQSV